MEEPCLDPNSSVCVHMCIQILTHMHTPLNSSYFIFQNILEKLSVFESGKDNDKDALNLGSHWLRNETENAEKCA